MKRENSKILLFLFLLILFAGIQKMAAQDIKVACVGNSITFGSGTITFPNQLDILLGEGWEVNNYGISGTTLLRNGDHPYWVEQAFTDVMNYQPDKIIIKLGTNDSKYYNWNNSENFYTDYLAMVDTFAGLASHPEIIICTPAKAYSGIYDINDTIIHDEIIPLIDSVAHNRDVKLVDLYTFTDNKPFYFPDGVHPNSGGNNYIARVLFDALVDSNMLVVADSNLLLNKPVTSENTEDLTQAYLTDGDLAYEWISEGLPATAVIDMGSERLVDNFQLLFTSDRSKGYQYTIEGSANAVDWTMLADQTGRNDTDAFFSVDTIAPSTMRYVRLSITSFSNSTSDTVKLQEFKALKSTGYEHAPIFSISKLSPISATIYIYPQYAGYAIAYYESMSTLSYFSLLNFTPNTTARSSLYRSGVIGTTYMYQTVNYYNGILVNSDVSKFTYIEPSHLSNPVDFNVEEVTIYPNPSNSGVLFTNLPSVSGASSIRIFDYNGRLIKIIEENTTNNSTFYWDGKDMNLNFVAAGMYICIIENGQNIYRRKLIVL